MSRAIASGPSDVHFYCSSGGNAGLACATSAVALNRPATIVLPTTVSPLIKEKLLTLGVNVHSVGNAWAQADRFLRDELLAHDPSGVYVPPFDHQHVWDGASTIVSELREQLDVPIHGIVCSVGGGGLVNGVTQAVESQPWNGAGGPSTDTKPTIIAVETEGADSLNASIRAGRHITLPGITSIATSLGASRVSEQTWRWSQTSKHLLSMTVSDADAAISCVRFADDARLLIEVSCGATLAVAYRGDLRRLLGKGLGDDEWAARNVVLEVCGGSGVGLETLAAYREKYGSESAIKTR